MKVFVPAIALATALAVSPASGEESGKIELGELTCKLKDVDNVVVYTKEEFDCTFKANSGAMDTYAGQIKNIGVNLSVKKDMTLGWLVLAASADDYNPGALKGTYVGGSAEVSIGGGVGAKVLVGGGEKSFTLQPVSVSGIAGGGASLGIQSFELR